MLSLASPAMRDTTEPSARTASRPATRARIGPWRTAWAPPALVATIPPTVAESRAARSIPTSQPEPRTAEATDARVAPAPTVSWPLTRSTGPSERRRVVTSTTAPSGGTAPPTSPVFPPCGTTATPSDPHRRSTAATSSRSAGRTTARLRPDQRPVQSTSNAAVRSGSVRTWDAPTMEARRCRTSPLTGTAPRAGGRRGRCGTRGRHTRSSARRRRRRAAPAPLR